MRVRKTFLVLLLFVLCLSSAMPVQAKVSQISVRVGEQKQLKAKKSWKKVKWKSSRPKIVTVSPKGKITAKMTGKAVVTAICGSKKQKYQISVKKAEVKIAAGGKTFKVQLAAVEG